MLTPAGSNGASYNTNFYNLVLGNNLLGLIKAKKEKYLMKKIMQHRWSLLAVAAVLLSGSFVPQLSIVRSALAGEKSEFTDQSLRGNYGFVANGFVQGATVSVVRAGIITFDGAGGCSIVSVVNVGTVGSSSQNSTTCTYSVNPDGTGTLAANLPVNTFNVFFVIDNHGSELQMMRTETGVIASGVAKKQYHDNGQDGDHDHDD